MLLQCCCWLLTLLLLNRRQATPWLISSATSLSIFLPEHLSWAVPRGSLVAILMRCSTKWSSREASPSPEPGIEVEDSRGLLLEVRIAGKQPAAMMPRPDGVLPEPAPHRRLTDRGDQTALDRLAGEPVDIGGYYMPDEVLCTKAMRPSATFNAIIDSI